MRSATWVSLLLLGLLAMRGSVGIVAALAADTQAQIVELRSELGTLKPRALQKRAEEEGVAEEALDEAESSEAIIDLIVRKHTAKLPITPDRVEPGLSEEECKHAVHVLELGREAADEQGWSTELASIGGRLANAEVSSLTCLQDVLDAILKQMYEIKELTSDEAIETNRGNTAKLEPKEDNGGLPLELQLVALNTLGPLLVHQGNYRLGAEVTIADIVLRSEKLKEDGPADDDGIPYPNTVAYAMSLWYNIKAILMFPEFPDLGIPRGALAGCTKVTMLLPTFPAAWMCQAKWALYHAENNICPGHPSGLDCASMALELYTQAFAINSTLKEDWHHWYEMGRGAALPSCEKGGSEKAKEYYNNGLDAARAAGDEEGIDALSFLVETIENEARQKDEKKNQHRESFTKHRDGWLEKLGNLTPRQLLNRAAAEGVSTTELDNASDDNEIIELIYQAKLAKHMETFKDDL